MQNPETGGLRFARFACTTYGAGAAPSVRWRNPQHARLQYRSDANTIKWLNLLMGGYSMFQVISTDKAPQAVGPYSQAVIANGFVFLSGQIPLDPATGTIVEGSIADQTRRVLNNLSSVLKSVGTDLDAVVKTTVFMKDLGQFDEMNKTYAEFFTGNKPARATVEVSKLPKGANIEIEAIALIKDSPN